MKTREGARALAFIGALSAALGGLQIAALFARPANYPSHAGEWIPALFAALILLSGGLAIRAWVWLNDRWGALPKALAGGASGDRRAPATISRALVLIASAAIVALNLGLWWSEGALPPARMTFFGASSWVDGRSMSLTATGATLAGGSLLIGLGAIAAAVLSGLAWIAFRARFGERGGKLVRGAFAAIGAVPYLVPAVFVRAAYREDVLFSTAEWWMTGSVSERDAFASMLGAQRGLFWAIVFLGVQAGAGLIAWLRDVWNEEAESDAFVLASIAEKSVWRAFLRDAIWLRRRHELSSILLSAGASAMMLEAITQTLIDLFHVPGFPLYPSLGASYFLASRSGDAPLGAHVIIFGAAALLVLAAALPRRAYRPVRAPHLPALDGLSLLSSVQWILGPSGSGKTTLMRAYAGEHPARTVYVPQDVGDALPAHVAIGEAARDDGAARYLIDLDDELLAERLQDPYTSTNVLSRGERQRLAFALALAEFSADRERSSLLLDEPTSAQDTVRTSKMIALLEAARSRAGRIVIASHDPSALGGGLSRTAVDSVLWLEKNTARAYDVQPGFASSFTRSAWVPRAAGSPDAHDRVNGVSAELGGFMESLGRMIAPAAEPERAKDPEQDAEPSVADGRGGWIKLPKTIRLGARSLSLKTQLVAVRGSRKLQPGTLTILEGLSGSGKSRLLREMTASLADQIMIGLVPQEPGRCFPGEMTVYEAIDAHDAIALEPEAATWFPSFERALWSRRFDSLSEGQRQRVLLAREGLRLDGRDAHGAGKDARDRRGGREKKRARLLLLDEPFGSVDPVSHVAMLERVVAWIASRPTEAMALIVSHSADADAAIAFERGIDAARWRLEVARWT